MNNKNEHRIVNLWKFIEFNERWLNCDTSRIDELSPSWFRRKEELEKTSAEYSIFIERLKRQHAIETGIIERMYDISKGVTETLIEKGFAEAFISHGDYSDNLTKDQLLGHLRDHLEAVDMVFDYVKDERPLTIGFIKELHQVVTAHQDFTEARDQFGNKLKIPLLKGKFKERENNPTRNNGNERHTYRYCPPEHVDAEMDNLVTIYNDLLKRNIHPLIIAAWFHHAFSIIHPFQDGNGRLARLLSSLIFIKYGYFPLTVLREDAPGFYIKSLEEADNGKPQPLIDYFINVQRANIEKALNIKSVTSSSFEHVAGILSEKLRRQKLHQEQQRQARIKDNRLSIFHATNEQLNKLCADLQEKLKGVAHVYVTSCCPDATAKQHYFINQIAKYAGKHDYYYNRFLPKAWFRFVFEISDQKIYQLIITEHHFGYQDDSYAIGAILEFIESEAEAKSTRNLEDDNFRKDSDGMIITNVPLDIKPYKVSLEPDKVPVANIKTYVSDIVTVTIAQIASELA